MLTFNLEQNNNVMVEQRIERSQQIFTVNARLHSFFILPFHNWIALGISLGVTIEIIRAIIMLFINYIDKVSAVTLPGKHSGDIYLPTVTKLSQ